MTSSEDLLDALRREGLLRHAPPTLPTVRGVTLDSREAEPGWLFVAVRGTQADGHQYVADAVRRGAVAIVVEEPTGAAVPELLVVDGRRAAIALARAWYGAPAADMTVVGVTGTNGKTTTAGLVRHLLNRDGDAASIGTLGTFDGRGERVPLAAGGLTTPGPVELQATFAALRDRGVRRVAMEASSHSLDQGRLDGLAFAAAIFTNLTRDHLDYHGTMEAYLAAKLRLLGLLAPGGIVVVNVDDPAWLVLPRAAATLTFGASPAADLRAGSPVFGASGTRFRFEGRFGEREASLPLPGEFNLANALGAAAAALGLGLTLAEVADRLASAPQVPGRMERLAEGPFTVLRDYAHTPDALERALAALRPITPGRLIVVFGCGGDRDRGKRPLMARVAGTLADLAVATSDNPRTEDPERILDDVVAGLPPGAASLRIADRRQAIATALGEARPGDTVLLAGKGHETYQIIGTEQRPFDEAIVVRELLGRAPA